MVYLGTREIDSDIWATILALIKLLIFRHVPTLELVNGHDSRILPTTSAFGCRH